jgi:hypothetical protein
VDDVESFDAVKLTKKLVTLKTSRLLDISGGVTGFWALAEEGWGDLDEVY